LKLWLNSAYIPCSYPTLLKTFVGITRVQWGGNAWERHSHAFFTRNITWRFRLY